MMYAIRSECPRTGSTKNYQNVTRKILYPTMVVQTSVGSLIQVSIQLPSLNSGPPKAKDITPVHLG